MKKKLAYCIVKFGQCLTLLGVIAFAFIFLSIMINGSWPEFLKPVQMRFALSDDLFGGASIPALIAIFISPGFIVQWLGGLFDPEN